MSEPLVVEALSVGCEVRRSFVKSMTSCGRNTTKRGSDVHREHEGIFPQEKKIVSKSGHGKLFSVMSLAKHDLSYNKALLEALVT